jgi:hypothetical protein
MNSIYKFVKILSINILIILILVIVFEIFAGNWLKKYSFGNLLRSHKDKKVSYTIKFGSKIFKHEYKRNYYGFREDSFDPKDVKIVFLGGSTGNESFLPYDLTIVGRLNTYLKKKNLPKIYNASVDGHSSVGFINNFYRWFPKINNFNPEIYIIYLGINERYYVQNNPNEIFGDNNTNIIIDDFELLEAQTKKKRMLDYLKNNSFILQKGKIIQLKYFPKKIETNYDDEKFFPGYSFNQNKDIKFLNNKEIIKKFKSTKMTEVEKNFTKSLYERLEILTKTIRENNAKPIYINQIMISGQPRVLYNANKTIEDYCVKNNIDFINLASKIDHMAITDFYDEMHTTDTGSDKISNAIKEDLEKIIIKIINKK